MNKKTLGIFFHILVWAVILVIVTVMPLRPGNSLSLSKTYPFIITYLFLVAIFYFNANVLIEKIFMRKRYVLFALSTILLLFVYIYFHHFIFSHFMQIDIGATPPDLMERIPPNDDIPFDKPPFEESLPFSGKRSGLPPRRVLLPAMQFFLFWILSVCYKLAEEWISLNKKKKEIEDEKSIIELAYLKAQINPHFILNTLNTIYSLSITGSNKASEAIFLYSQVIRYLFDKIDVSYVPLKEEIDYINNYIDLQILRFTDTLRIDFQIEGEIDRYVIAPLIFISFIENCFQYGISNHFPSIITIGIKASADQIYFYTENKKYKKDKLKLSGKKIGLTNTKRKLSLIYPDRHQLFRVC